jgi:hypothetical protein
VRFDASCVSMSAVTEIRASGRAFAFVSFEDQALAQRVVEKMDGRGYDSLILNVQLSRSWLSLVHRLTVARTEPREQQ